MNLLLDAHALLWFLDDGPHLVPTAKSVIEDPANRKLVPDAAGWARVSLAVSDETLERGIERLAPALAAAYA